MSQSPFDISVFTTPHSGAVRIDVGTTTQQIHGGLPADDARTVGYAMLGAADVSQGKMTTEYALAFLAAGKTVSEDGIGRPPAGGGTAPS